jgi:hypothetical protein
MGKLREILGKTLFWSYDRGTWPYDLMVIAIVLFVFLSPRGWFNDRPSVSGSQPASRIELLSEDAADGSKTFRVGAGLLSQPRPDPAFERRAHDFLSKNVQELQGKRFQIRRIETGQETDGTIRYYDITVR